MARLALVIHRETQGVREERLGRILAFFGVPWMAVGLPNFVMPPHALHGGGGFAVLGTVETLAAALAVPSAAAVLKEAAALYAYAAEDRDSSMRALSALSGLECASGQTGTGGVSVDITNRCPELTGPMSGLHLTVQLAAEDGTIAPSEPVDQGLLPVVTAGGGSTFVGFRHHDVPAYFCASAAMVDIDEPVHRNYYDVKDHFFSAVPLVMFITSTFRDVAWRASELGACLIIDDPLLKNRYGFCDFVRLRDLMIQHRFTTNIAFIPWNWRRTSRSAAEFFQRESKHFSVSIHGCDHVAREFGDPSSHCLNLAAGLAKSRMRKHQARSGILHDRVMVFPQGVFSSKAPGILKRHEYTAAVNTELHPIDHVAGPTKLRDAWDVAIVRYGTFAIFTRRYAFHGLENFAFDLLIGKPCLIVAHHQFFRHGYSELVDLVERLNSLTSSLRWRPLGDLTRRAFRRRTGINGVELIQMYGSEVTVTNSTNDAMAVEVSKREDDLSAVTAVRGEAGSVEWREQGDRIVFGGVIQATSEASFNVNYKRLSTRGEKDRPFLFKARVAVRRYMSECRDQYLRGLVR